MVEYLKAARDGATYAIALIHLFEFKGIVKQTN